METMDLIQFLDAKDYILENKPDLAVPILQNLSSKYPDNPEVLALYTRLVKPRPVAAIESSTNLPKRIQAQPTLPAKQQHRKESIIYRVARGFIISCILVGIVFIISSRLIEDKQRNAQLQILTAANYAQVSSITSSTNFDIELISKSTSYIALTIGLVFFGWVMVTTAEATFVWISLNYRKRRN